MSERLLDLDLTQGTEVRLDTAIKADEPSNEERLQYRHKLAQVLDRTVTVDRLGVQLPGNLDGFWCSNDGLSIAQYELKGWKVDTDFASRNSLHDIGDGKGVIADVIHMVRPKWMSEEEKVIKDQNYAKTHLSDPRKQKEERDFLSQNELPPLIASRSDQVSGLDIEEAIKPKKG